MLPRGKKRRFELTCLLFGLAIAGLGGDVFAAPDEPSAKAPSRDKRSLDETTGVLPVGRNDKPLNLDFETGTLKDWTAEGDAFKGQPVRGDIPEVLWTQCRP